LILNLFTYTDCNRWKQ